MHKNWNKLRSNFRTLLNRDVLDENVSPEEREFFHYMKNILRFIKERT
jgi:hypothetical protein